MVTIPQTIVDEVVAALPDSVRRMLRMGPLYLAGGFIRAVVAKEKPSDLDIFGSTREELERYARLLSGDKGMRKTRNAISVSLPGSPQVQFILRWIFPEPERVIASFDFTISQAVIWFNRGLDKWEGAASERFFQDVETKVLVYTSPTREEDAAGSLLRVRKFLLRGYDISDQDLSNVVARIVVATQKEAEEEKFAADDGDTIFEPTWENRTWRIMDRARRVGGDSV